MKSLLGEIFVRERLATQEQVNECLFLQQQDKPKEKPLGWYLIKRNYIDDGRLWEMLQGK